MADGRYKADLGGGSLKVPESRIVAALLLDEVSDEQWRHAIEVENVLQKRSRGTAARQASLLRARLRTMGPDLWRLVRDGSQSTATHAVFAGAIKHSPLLGDFLDLMVRDQFRLFRADLPRRLWGEFLELCRNRDPMMPVWRETTAAKQADSAFRILSEVGYLADTKSYRLSPIRISPEVMTYLRENDEQYVMRCIQVSL